jgi:TRAP-type C4-dicarboxylate transport system permease small subunit
MSHAVRYETEFKKLKSTDNGRLARLTRLMTRINDWIMAVSTVAMLAAACVLTLGVLLRYFLKVPTDWQDETAVFLIVGSIFMCGAYVQSYRGHVGIEAVAAILPEAVNRVRRKLVDIASFGFCAFFSWKSWTLLVEALREGQTTSSSFAPPLWIPYGLMAAGMTLLTLQLLLQIPTHFLPEKEAE